VVQVTAKIQMDFNTFFATNGPTAFINNLTAFLNIDPSRVKIVKIVPGSVVIDFQVLPAVLPSDPAAPGTEPTPVDTSTQNFTPPPPPTSDPTT